MIELTEQQKPDAPGRGDERPPGVATIELTEQQSRALRDHPTDLDVRDPATGKTYRLTATPPIDEYQLPAGVLTSMRAYWADLPGLLADRKTRKKWVLYHGSERIDVATEPRVLSRLVEAKGYPAKTCFIGRIEPQDTPPWVPEEIELPGYRDLEDDPAVED